MIAKFCAFVLAGLGLAALAGCGAGPQPTPTPVATITAPSATPTVGPTRAPVGGTPLTVAPGTPAATPSSPVAGTTLTPGGGSTPAPTVSGTPATAGPTASAERGLETPGGTPVLPGETATAPLSTPVATPTGPPATPAATPTGVTVAVIGFNVWQDFMPAVPPSGPPLYASVELNVTNHGSTPVHEVLATCIVVRRPEGEVVLDRGLQGGPPDTVTATDLAPGETRHYSYRSTALDTSPAMTENEAVSGVLTLSFDGVEQTIPLPATRVLFTH
jgi:hypothetical protein